MYSFKDLNFNLGIPKLLVEWKSFFSTKYLTADLTAGITVALVAIPLSLAIALASGVSPEVGVVTAIIAGIVCALFGGTPLSVSGPAAAMTILLADIVEKFGVANLTLICLVAGLFQLISGIVGLGKLARFVPLPVVAGFTAGIGVIIIVGQLPRAFGLAPPPESHVFDVLHHIKGYFHEINYSSLLLVVLTLLIIRGLPRIFPKAPAILISVVVAAAIVTFFNIPITLIGKIPNTLPTPHFPTGWGNISIQALLFNSFTVYLLASLETLLSSSAIDKITNDTKSNANQELIGQGMGNIAVSLFSGLPVTGVIARSITNVRAGAKTRRASIFHSLVILVVVFFLAPWISLIPIAALAGVLFSIAFSMINYREFHSFWLTSRSEGLIYGITFLTIIFVDLIAGVQAGIIAAALLVLFNAAKANLHITNFSNEDVIRLSCTGGLTFLSTGKISEIEKQLHASHAGQIVILDLTNITNLDSSGAAAIVDLFKHCSEKGIKFYIKGLARRFEPLFRVCDGDELLDFYYLVSESELLKKESTVTPRSSRGRLIHGFQQYFQERQDNDKRLFENIAHAQDPHTLFIACSDSRIVPSLITSSDPGELFIIRNVGNFIPAYDLSSGYSEAAALEFSLNNLNITDIVICGHSNCGAIHACRGGELDLLQLNKWIKLIKAQLPLDQSLSLTELAHVNVLNQVKNLQSYPLIKKKVAAQQLNIHAWFFNVEESLIYEWDSESDLFNPIVFDAKQKI